MRRKPKGVGSVVRYWPQFSEAPWPDFLGVVARYQSPNHCSIYWFDLTKEENGGRYNESGAGSDANLDELTEDELHMYELAYPEIMQWRERLVV